MRQKRLVSRIAIGIAAALTVVACTSDGATEGTGNAGPNKLDEIIESGTLRVAVLPDFPPASVQNASGDFEGYEPDIARLLAEALGVELEFVSTDGASRLPLLEADRVDVNISSWTATDERARAVGYSIPYFAAGASVLYSNDNPIESYDDLAGLSVSVARGSTNDTIMTEDFPDTEIVRFESIADAVQALRSGQVDAAVEGQATVLQEVENDPESFGMIDEEPLRPSLISMGVLPDDQIWLNFLNNFIRNLNASGTNAEIYQEWYGTEISDLIG